MGRLRSRGEYRRVLLRVPPRLADIRKGLVIENQVRRRQYYVSFDGHAAAKADIGIELAIEGVGKIGVADFVSGKLARAGETRPGTVARVDKSPAAPLVPRGRFGWTAAESGQSL